jgi:hypothetical protein
MDLAVLLYGFNSGAAQSFLTAKPMLKIRGSCAAPFVEMQGCLADVERTEERQWATCR